MDKNDIEALADLLEENGFEDSLGFIKDILIPTAIKSGLSLRQAMRKHANSTKNEQTSEFQLNIALSQIEYSNSFRKLKIDEIVEKPS